MHDHAHTHAHGKSDRNILVAFFLNLGFCLFEIFGGIFTHSFAILSDSVHDLGDALTIGISYLCEKKSRRAPDDTYTYGYARYSILAGVFTTLVLLLGAGFVLRHAAERLLSPAPVRTGWMIALAVIGVIVNFLAARFTRDDEGSINQKAVNLHMLEDVLGWAAVLVGSLVMHFTGFYLLDTLLSVLISIYLIVHALLLLKDALGIMLEKVPEGLTTENIRRAVSDVPGVLGVHHIHLWSLDSETHFATMHLVVNGNEAEIKEAVRAALSPLGIRHATLETEREADACAEDGCSLPESEKKE